MGALQGALSTIATFEIIPGEFFEEHFYDIKDEDKTKDGEEPDFVPARKVTNPKEIPNEIKRY